MDLFLDTRCAAPRQIVLDLDATDVPLHEHQEGRFFHGYSTPRARHAIIYPMVCRAHALNSPLRLKTLARR